MADMEKDQVTDNAVNDSKKETKVKASKSKNKDGNFFVKTGRKIKKFWKEYVSELKKVSWMSWKDIKKNTVLVVCTVLAFGVMIGIIDATFGEILTGFAALIG